MIEHAGLPRQAVVSTQTLTPAQKAQVIYAQAREEITGKLWCAALGESDSGATLHGSDGLEKRHSPLSIDALLSVLQERGGRAGPVDAGIAALPSNGVEPHNVDAAESHSPAFAGWSSPQDDADNQSAQEGEALGLVNGPNARFAGPVGQAAARTGLPASALATIIDAEAAKGRDGRWLPYSRNPRSSAAGLGQFLNQTWIGEAQRQGTWLHATAEKNGWLNSRGHVRGESKAALLALRYDPQASIEAVADYAKANVATLRRSGVEIGNTVTQLAQSAYLAHHLGTGDAVKFLKGSLSMERARLLLNTQIGSAFANQRIAVAGNAVAAHRNWLMDYVERHIRPEKFA